MAIRDPCLDFVYFTINTFNMKHKHRICKVCKWVAFPVTRKYAEAEVKKFNKYYSTLTEQDQISHYGGHGSSITRYETCTFCGGSYKNFRAAKNSEVPFGSTMGPIIYGR